ANTAAVQRDHISFDETAPAVEESYELLSVDLGPLEHRTADDRVETGAVPATAENSDPRHALPPVGWTSTAPDRFCPNRCCTANPARSQSRRQPDSAGCDETGLVGEHHGLCAVAQVQFREN